MSATVSGVARLAGVSATTVSLCFKENSRISAATKARVLAAADELGYIPNQFARRLRYGKSGLIALVVTETNTLFMADVIAGVEREAAEKGYDVLVFSTFRDVETEKKVVQSACGLKVEGLIIAACEENNEILRRLDREEFPMVFIDSIPAGMNCDYVVNDTMSVARLGTEYLLNLGHKDILLINGAEKHRHCSAFSGMANGYKASLEASGADNGNNLVLHSGIYIKDGYDAVERAMANGLKFTAVFAISDMVALGAIEFLESHGLHVPEDISVLGIDNSEIASLNRIGLSTIETCSNEVYKEDMGALAATILLDRLSSPAPAFQKRSIVLKPRLVLRNSCKRLEVISKEHLYK